MKCCFIGHRKINYSKELEEKLEKIIENLIIKFNVFTFLFGSRSEFNDLCHKVVTKLKEKYPEVRRVMYTCKSESCTFENEREKFERLIFKFTGSNSELLGYEEEREFNTKYVSGRASYIERNQAMINESDYCIFYYDESYKPPLKKIYKQDKSYYKPNSGTKLAFDYAKRKNKKILNVFIENI